MTYPITGDQHDQIAKISDIDQLRYFRAKLIEQRTAGITRLSIKSPVSSREVEYRSDAEMAAAIADLDRRIAAFSGPPKARFVQVRSTRGW